MSQLCLFSSEELEEYTLSQEDFHVNRIASQESVGLLLTNVICGGSMQESFAKLNPDGLWLKMCQGYFTQKVDGSLEEFSMIWPLWGILSGGVAMELHPLERLTGETESLSLPIMPTPNAIAMVAMWATAEQLKDGKTERKSGASIGSNLSWLIAKWHLQNGGERDNHLMPDPCFYEMMMGFPENWTKVD